MKRFCAFCGTEVAMHVECDTGCPNCIATHQAEMEAGLIPAGLPKEAYKFWLWKRIRQLERDVVAGRTSEPDAKTEVARLVESAKEDYEEELFIEAARRQKAAALESERNGPTGFLI